MARDRIANHIIFNICGGVKDFSNATGIKEGAVRNYLQRGLPGVQFINDLITSLQEAGFDVSASDVLTLAQRKESNEYRERGN